MFTPSRWVQRITRNTGIIKRGMNLPRRCHKPRGLFLNLPDKVGRAFYYILIAAAAIGIVNLPIQVLQLVMLGKLTFPNISLPFVIPWYALIIGVVGIIILFMLAFGFFWARLGLAKAQNNVSNENNLQMCDIIERLERIEKQVTRAENDWR
jgi:hypothetical protein